MWVSQLVVVEKSDTVPMSEKIEPQMEFGTA